MKPKFRFVLQKKMKMSKNFFNLKNESKDLKKEKLNIFNMNDKALIFNNINFNYIKKSIIVIFENPRIKKKNSLYNIRGAIREYEGKENNKNYSGYNLINYTTSIKEMFFNLLNYLIKIGLFIE